MGEVSCETGKGAHPWPPGPLGCRSGGPCQPTEQIFWRPNEKNLSPGRTSRGCLGARNGQKAKIVGFWAPFGLLGGPGTAETGRLAPKTLPHSVRGWYASISCAWALYETSTALLGPPKGPILAQKGPFGGPGGSRAAPGGLIWVEVF